MAPDASAPAAPSPGSGQAAPASRVGGFRAPAWARPASPADAGANAPVANIAQPGEAFGTFVQRGGSPSMDSVKRLQSNPSAVERAMFDDAYGAGAADRVIGPANFGRRGAGIGP